MEGDAQDREPDPETDRENEAGDDRRARDQRHPVEAERRPGILNRTKRDEDDPRHHQPSDKRGRSEHMKRKDPILEAHPRDLTIWEF